MPAHEQQTSVSDLGRAVNHPTLDQRAVLAAEVHHIEHAWPNTRHARVPARDLRVTQATRRHAWLSQWPPSDLDRTIERNHSLAACKPAALGRAAHDQKHRPSLVPARPYRHFLGGAGGLGGLAAGHAATIVA
jgi:hypothetical protein